MNIVTIDLETYWDDKHSLSNKKLTTFDYCLSPKTQVMTAAIKWNNEPTEVLVGEEAIREYIDDTDWSDCMVVGHNMAGFDSIILCWRFGMFPRLWGCTLTMARPIHEKDGVGLSLGKLVRHYGIGEKDNRALVTTKGRRLEEITDHELEQLIEYNIADTEQCYQLFKVLKKQTSVDELLLIDMTIRMMLEPQFKLALGLVVDTREREIERKNKTMLELADKLHIDRKVAEHTDIVPYIKKELASSNRFSELLRRLGADVPMKVSPTTGKEIPAFAKTDEGFMALLEHDNELVAAAAEARADVRSTILETRLLKVEAANDTIVRASGNPDIRTPGITSASHLPITLKYYGATTTGRWSGWLYNPQNLPRINPAEPKLSDSLRKALTAPRGHKVVVADLSGIELRINHFLWRVQSSMDLFTENPGKADLYKDFASNLYGVPVEEVTKGQRQVGKAAHLGLGFQAGAATFRDFAKGQGVDMGIREAENIVIAWRNEYQEIKSAWWTCQRVIETMFSSGEENMAVDPWGLVTTGEECLQTPGGAIRYPDLRIECDEEGREQYFYGVGHAKRKIYGGQMVENIVQHLARQVISANALSIAKELGILPALMVHDELVYVVPEGEAQETLHEVQNIMRTPPHWWPELAVWSEGDISDNYGDAK